MTSTQAAVTAADNAIRNAIYYPVSDHVMLRGEGIYLYDADGNRYIDCASATFNLSLGYGYPDVIAAMKDQADDLVHLTSSFQSPVISELVGRLIELSPPNITKVHLKVSGGSTANEGAIKMAQAASGMRDVITLFRSHHGQTVLTTSLSGNAFRRAPLPVTNLGSLQVPDPYCFRCFYGQRRATCGLMCVDRIDDFIEFASSGQIAAVLVEPISGNGGNIVPPPGYFTKLRKFCDERGIFLIFDEIQTGIGRTGYLFAADYLDVRPDATTLAKGLGGSGAQVAAILTNTELGGLPADQHSFTYGANLMAAAAANATLKTIARPEFLSHVRSVGDHLMNRLMEIKQAFDVIGDVRGLGLMIGLELVDGQGEPAVALTNELTSAAMDAGLILRSSRYGRGNVIKIRPPLILSHAEADLICDRLVTLFRRVV